MMMINDILDTNNVLTSESHLTYVVHEGDWDLYWWLKEVLESISLLSELEVFVTGMIHQLPDCMSRLKKLRQISKADINVKKFL